MKFKKDYYVRASRDLKVPVPGGFMTIIEGTRGNVERVKEGENYLVSFHVAEGMDLTMAVKEKDLEQA